VVCQIYSAEWSRANRHYCSIPAPPLVDRLSGVAAQADDVSGYQLAISGDAYLVNCNVDGLWLVAPHSDRA
jgi:hypothetical protein